MKRPSGHTIWLIVLTIMIIIQIPFSFAGLITILAVAGINDSITSLEDNQYNPSDDILRKHMLRLTSQFDIDICDLKLETEMINESEHAKCVVRGQTGLDVHGNIGDPMDYQKKYPTFQEHLEMKASENNQTVDEYLNDFIDDFHKPSV